MSAFDHVVVQIPRSEEGPITHVAGQLLLAPVVVLLPKQELEGQSKPSALCAFCKVYFSAQPNKLRPILKFEKYYPVEHIFVPACSSARKIHFFKF